MKCIYCGSEMKHGKMYCDSCGKEAQLVPDYNALEDDYINNFMEEREDKKQSGDKKRDLDVNQTKEDQKVASRLIMISSLVVLFVIGILIAIIYVVISNNHAKDFDYQLSQAQRNYEKGKIEEALEHYDTARNLPEGRTDAALQVKVGNLYLEQKDYDSAEMAFYDAIGIDNKCKDAYKGLILIYRERKEFDKISELGTKIEELDLSEVLEEYIVSAPQFSSSGGTYDTNLKLSLSAAEGDTIYYTLDGKDPEKYGEIYKDEIKFTTEGKYTVAAVCKSSAGEFSATITQEYQIEAAAPDRPEVFPEGCSVHADTYVTVSVPENCEAYYTWDGSLPDVTSEKYTEPILIPKGSNVLSIVVFDINTNRKSDVYRTAYTYFDN